MKSFAKFVGFAFAMTVATGMAIASEPALHIGSAAPELKIAKWVKGSPVKGFEKGKVYVVEFWATWCGPCKQSIPHLTELAKKYKDKATFIGVDAFEVPKPKDETYFAQVEKFVSDFGPKMEYNVAIDGKEGFMANNWMNAAQQPGIPTAFIVDQTGTVAWIGHPMVGLDEAVGQVLDGTYDIKAAADKARKAREEQERQEAKLKPFLDPFKAKKYPEAVAAMDKAFAEDPTLEKPYALMRFICLANYDEKAANEYARKLENGIYADQGTALYSLMMNMISERSPLKNPDYALASEIGEKALANLPAAHPARPFLLDGIATTYAKQNNLDKAISFEEQALKAAEATKDFNAETKAKYTQALDGYRKQKAG